MTSKGGNTKEDLRKSFRQAKVSTASLGNFDQQVKGEKKEKIGGKRKYNALFSDQSKVCNLILSTLNI